MRLVDEVLEAGTAKVHPPSLAMLTCAAVFAAGCRFAPLTVMRVPTIVDFGLNEREADRAHACPPMTGERFIPDNGDI